ncbi:MAG: M48 family metallopeptidase [Xanthomonadales bacterium]
MNFFEQQDKARKQSRWLIFAFIVAVLAIVVAIDLLILLMVGVSSMETEGVSPLSPQLFADNLSLLAGGAIATLLVIGLASLFKTMGLRAGGGKVARELGGNLVESEPRDARLRRLRNIVEEIALASGVPVPEIYVLEQESGINAFAAGYTPSDAAVAVSRGALEKLSRDELQGVIAHEFSHILNGDMRINIRLMGALFGILVLALIGRRILIHSTFVGRSSRDKNGAVVLAIAIGLMAVGYIGLFFGRWIKAAVSRQREYLADASAVQFTRDPNGIGGALKKIAVYSEASYLEVDTEEVSHMLFGDGRKMSFFSTHPPLEDRIKRIDPGFQREELDRLAAKISRDQASAEKARDRKAKRAGKSQRSLFDVDNIIDQIGNPDWERMFMAATIAASIPDDINRAAHSPEWAGEVLFYALLDSNAQVRDQQLLIIAQLMGTDSESKTRSLLEAGGIAAPEQRLPLLEVAFPALKRRPPDLVKKILDTVEALSHADGRIDVFEYLLARIIDQHLRETYNPHTVKVSGRKSLRSCHTEALQVVAVLAGHGDAGGEAAQSAFMAGLEVLGVDSKTTMPSLENWTAALDQALPKLDRLKSAEKEKLVRALITVVLHDGLLAPAELELLRVTCDLIHVPLPMLSTTK